VLATQSSDGFRVFVPPGAAVESRQSDTFLPLQPDALQSIGTRQFISLKSGSAIRLSGDDEMTLVAYVQSPIPKPFVNPLRTAPWLLIMLLGIFLSGFGAFIAFGPRDDTPDFTGKSVPPVAVRLIAPEPKKKEEAKKKLEELKKKEPVKKEKVAEKAPPKEKEKPKEVPQETKTAIKAVQKLAAAGPAIKDLLAAVDKLGNGPGRKDAKNDMKLSGLIGKQPIANAGLGSFGLGGGGSGGIGTKGMEILRGKGGSGIGALGAGNVGKGAVGGSVSRASARTVSAQGTIDKDAVAKVINSHLHEVSSCYERALLKEPGLAGKIVLEWGITTSGSVSSTKTKSSSMKSAAVEACIINAIKTWKFPAAKGAGVMISYPFMFNSVGY
jgi:outer membrane biosynthesis protein TonB